MPTIRYVWDLKKDFNKHFIPLLDNDSRYLVLKGSAGSGKSFFIAERYIRKLINCKVTGNTFNLLVVRQTARTNRDSTFALFKQVINKFNAKEDFIINEGDIRIKHLGGSEILFAGLDDVEKLKSITFSKGELTDIWIEEASEIQEKDFNQLDVRLRGGNSKKQITISFNPIDINHWLKKRFFDTQADNITIDNSTYKDNEFLDDDYSKLLESYKDTDPYYYQVYALGEWGVLGDTVFDARKIKERMQHLPLPVKKGWYNYSQDMSEYNFITSDAGYITIYEDVNKNHAYVIGGDTSSGEGSDYSICQVIDYETGKQVAVLRNRMDLDLYARQVYCLAKTYNNALVSIEMNFDTTPIRKLEEFGYHNQYIREIEDTITGQIKKAYGFKTDQLSRPRILSNLIEIVREHTHYFNDKQTLEEMLTFVRNDNKKGRVEAQDGAHDDLVMALAIAYDAFNQCHSIKPIEDEEEREESYTEEAFANF